MGKKNRKGRSDPGSAAKAQNRVMMDLVNALLDKCSFPASGGPKDWDDYLQIHDLVEKIRAKQKGSTLQHFNRSEHVEEFMDWCKKNGITVDAVSIQEFGSAGFGLKANRDIQKSETFISVPRKAMLTTEDAKKTGLGAVMEQDRILQAMPNVLLSLYLLCERHNKDTFWMPYFKMLPSTYSTTLYFTSDDLQQLKGSPAFYDSLNQYRNIARQYAYFYRLFQGVSGVSDVNKLPLHHSFCYDDYRWAVSTVMTRQNQIPSEDGAQVISGLIPLWDMCNHENGQVTTGYDPQTHCSECFALREFKKDEQIFIFYGDRSNADLLLHNGFVYSANENDCLSLKLGISKNDPLFAMKAEMLARLGHSHAKTFQLDCGENPVNPELLSFLRVFSMEEGELKERLVGEYSTALLEQLGDITRAVSQQNENKCWAFLEMRASLLLKSYPKTADEDDKLLGTSELTVGSRLAIELRKQEKLLLQNAVAFAQKQKNLEKELAALTLCHECTACNHGNTETKLTETTETVTNAETSQPDTEEQINKNNSTENT